MAATSRGYPYPDNLNAPADGPETFRVLAEAINTDVGTVAGAAASAQSTAAGAVTVNNAQGPKITTLEGQMKTVNDWITATDRYWYHGFAVNVPQAQLTAANAKNGFVYTYTMPVTIRNPTLAKVTATRRSGGLERQWVVYVNDVTSTQIKFYIARIDAVENAGGAMLSIDVIVEEQR